MGQVVPGRWGYHINNAYGHDGLKLSDIQGSYNSGHADAASMHTAPRPATLGLHPVIHILITLSIGITWITTDLPTSEGWMAELVKARSMQPYIILYKTALQLRKR